MNTRTRNGFRVVQHHDVASAIRVEGKAEKARLGPSMGGEWRDEAGKTGPCESTVREAEDLASQAEAAKADPVVEVRVKWKRPVVGAGADSRAGAIQADLSAGAV